MVITLTTDFGHSDPFVGIMKGVILAIAPGAQIVDLTHEVPSYEIDEAAFVLDSAYAYFRPGTIHVVVVDPGVGSSRRPIAAAANGHIFVAPDNGVLSRILQRDPVVYHVRNESLFLDPVSHTFHGRDIFAPVAAHLARGAPLESIGPRINDVIIKPVPELRVNARNRLAGTVIRIDKFGNIVTNLRSRDLRGGFSIRIAGAQVQRLYTSFQEAEPGEFFAIEGSTGYIEVALKQGSAARSLDVGRGAEIELETDSSNH